MAAETFSTRNVAIIVLGIVLAIVAIAGSVAVVIVTEANRAGQTQVACVRAGSTYLDGKCLGRGVRQ